MSIPRRLHPHFISSSYVHLLSEVVARWNISTEELFWGTGVEIEKLQDINYKISLSSFKKVITRSIKLTQEQGVSFFMGRRLKISSHGLLGFTVAISKNTLDAIETINQFIKLQCSFVELNFSIEHEHAYYHIIYDNTAINMKDQTDLQVYEFSCVCFLIGFVRLVRFFIPDFKPSIDLQCKFPKYFSRFDEILSTTFKEIRYEQPRTGLITSPQLLGLPLCMSDPLNYEKFKLLCQKELDKLSVTQDILYHVKHLIDDPNEGLLNIDQVRKAKAQKLLLNPFMTKDEIAKNLGYASLSSFNRAYKRWENQ